MSVNLGRTDRITRVVIGLAAFLVGLLLTSWWGLLGIIPISTATAGWCPIKSVVDSLQAQREPTSQAGDA